MYIQTDGNQPIISKKDYIAGSYYIDPMGVDGIKAIGSVDAPLPLQIRGRGNYTWSSFNKKPYRIKLDTKEALLGMNKSKHFALLAHADDQKGFLKNAVAFEISKMLGMPYTPDFRPVEVVLNGNYIGLYFLTETIRVAKDRVNITEQPDYSLDIDEIEGGWLIELDNYKDDSQVIFPVDNTNLDMFYVTYHSPENLSAAQEFYLSYQLSCIKDAIYCDDKYSTDWEKLVDLESLARFYIIAEVTDHLEAFLGSCYLYKDKGTKWKFGPIWDYGHAFNDWHEKQRFIYEGTTHFPHSIIEEIAKFPSFQETVRRVWKEFYPYHYSLLENFIDQYVDYIMVATQHDYSRWPSYGNKYEIACAMLVKQMLNIKVSWLNSIWSDYSTDIQSTDATESVKSMEFDLQGNRVTENNSGIHIVKTISKDGSVKIRKVIR